MASQPVLYDTDYAFQSNTGLFLSYHTASHKTILYKNPHGVWLEPSLEGSSDQPLTGDIIVLEIAVFPNDLWLYYFGTTPSLVWTTGPSQSAQYPLYSFQLFTDLSMTSGRPINIGDSVYINFAGSDQYLTRDVSDPEYVIMGGSSDALLWTIETYS